jgi:hypothetical protein
MPPGNNVSFLERRSSAMDSDSKVFNIDSKELEHFNRIMKYTETDFWGQIFSNGIHIGYHYYYYYCSTVPCWALDAFSVS